MRLQCSHCDIRDDATSKCVYKSKAATYNTNFKEIRGKDGKQKRKYSLLPTDNRTTIIKRNIRSEVEAKRQYYQDKWL